MNEIRRICITPTRNESWVIEKFLAAAKTWADHVIVADQGSTDGTLQYLQNTPGIETVINDRADYDESYRSRLLLGRARQFGEKRILIALDADEALSANSLGSKDWERIEAAKPGTVLRFRWVNILPGFKEAWIPSNLIPCGFVDDGSEHLGKKIHSPRVPYPSDAPVLDLEDIVVLHFQYVAWDRVVSKHHWYQVWEHLNHPEKGSLQIFRQYHHMYGSWAESEIHSLRPEWLDNYDCSGISFRDLKTEPITWWDREVMQLMREHGPDHFRKIAIWNTDWNAVAAKIGVNGINLEDPRSGVEKVAHRLLKITQSHRGNLAVRALEHLLRRTGW